MSSKISIFILLFCLGASLLAYIGALPDGAAPLVLVVVFFAALHLLIVLLIKIIAVIKQHLSDRP